MIPLVSWCLILVVCKVLLLTYFAMLAAKVREGWRENKEVSVVAVDQLVLLCPVTLQQRASRYLAGDLLVRSECM